MGAVINLGKFNTFEGNNLLRMKYKFLLIVFYCSLMALNGNTQQHFFAGQTGDSVKYTDINPDINLDFNSQYLIDIDNDGFADFKIKLTYINGPMMSESFFTSISGMNKNKIIYTPTPILDTNGICPCYKIAKIFNYGDPLNILKDTCKEAQMYYSTISLDGLCQANEWERNTVPKYIGLVLNRNDSLIYGWIKVFTPQTVSVMEYAVNMSGITQIKNQYYDQSIKAFPNPVKDLLHVYMPLAKYHENYNLHLMNDLGVEVIKKKINGINSKLDLRYLNTGTYLLEIRDHSKIYFKQKILKR